jgi:hypothetical protein
MAETPLIGYSGDCVVRGLIEVPNGVRLTEFLNDAPRIFVSQARLFSLEDGHAVDAGSIDLGIDELLAVEAPPGTANTGHKIRTKQARVQFELGPYEILGHVHAPTTGDPVAAMARRKPMVPLTQATIAMTYAGRHHLRDVDVLIFNRDLATVVEAVKYEPSKLDDMIVTQVDPRAKDYTSAIYGGPGDSTL